MSMDEKELEKYASFQKRVAELCKESASYYALGAMGHRWNGVVERAKRDLAEYNRAWHEEQRRSLEQGLENRAYNDRLEPRRTHLRADEMKVDMRDILAAAAQIAELKYQVDVLMYENHLLRKKLPESVPPIILGPRGNDPQG